MKRLALLSVCVMLLASDASARTWTDAKGRKIDADFVALDQDGVRMRRHSDGEVYRVPVETLSKSDQQHVYSEAIDKSTKQIEQNPRDAAAYNTRGYAYSRRGEYDQAINDYGRAVRSDNRYTLAYRNRGDLYTALDRGDTEKHKEYAEKFRERNRKRWSALKDKYRNSKQWQPLNSTTRDVGAKPFRQLAMADYKKAEEYGGYGGYGRGGYGKGGYGKGGGGGKGYGKGSGSGKGEKGEGDGELEVFPAKAQQGQTISLVADASAIRKGMPVKIDPTTGKPVKKEKGERYAPKEDIKTVDFYRDSNGSGKFEEDEDQYLGADSNGVDGGKYRATVSSAEFPEGIQGYFAVGRGAEGTAKPYDGKGKGEGKGKGKGEGNGSGKPVPSDTKATSKAVAGSGEITPPAEQTAQGPPAPGSPAPGKPAPAAAAPGTAPAASSYAADDRYVGRDRVILDDDGNRVYLDDDDLVIRDRADAYVDNAVTLIEDGDYTTAIDRYSDALELVDNADYYTSRANLYRTNGNYTKAIIDYNEAVRLQPRTAEYYYNRGLAFRGAGKLDEAIADYTTALELDSKMSKAYNNRSSAYGAKGLYKKAIVDATAAIELNSTDARAYFNRAMAHLKSDQYQQAINDLKVVTSLSPDDASAYAFRGHAYEKMGEDQLAQADFAKAKELNPALK